MGRCLGREAWWWHLGLVCPCFCCCCCCSSCWRCCSLCCWRLQDAPKMLPLFFFRGEEVGEPAMATRRHCRSIWTGKKLYIYIYRATSLSASTTPTASQAVCDPALAITLDKRGVGGLCNCCYYKKNKQKGLNQDPYNMSTDLFA